MVNYKVQLQDDGANVYPVVLATNLVDWANIIETRSLPASGTSVFHTAQVDSILITDQLINGMFANVKVNGSSIASSNSIIVLKRGDVLSGSRPAGWSSDETKYTIYGIRQ